MNESNLRVINLTHLTLINGIHYLEPDGCFKYFRSVGLMTGPQGETWCNATHDKALCWPATPNGTKVIQNCPNYQRLIPTEFAEKICTHEGRWYVRSNRDNQIAGWTDYWNCYSEDMKRMIRKMGLLKLDPKTREQLRKWAIVARILELTGVTVSVIFLLVALIILYYFRALKCDRTRIHRNLFIAILIHDIIQLIRHTDVHIAGQVFGSTTVNSGGNDTLSGVKNNKGTIYHTVGAFFYGVCFQRVK